MATSTFRVEGLRDLLRATDQMGKETKRSVRDELRKVAEPARDEAQSLFMSEVAGHSGHATSDQSRYGISVRKTGSVSVEQRRKGKSGRPSAKRPSFTRLQWQRVLNPTADHTLPHLEAAMADVLDRLERRWRS